MHSARPRRRSRWLSPFVREVRKGRLLAKVLPAMLDQMVRGDMPNEQPLRTNAAASPEV
ncbi:hypothetical protein REMIM1_PE00189 (plasmid) [Rhizobium etli bv. mimosae str. Mim1]|nr:hypothetical protein REMIM1_PE00189 [Rhizobium etli bv. mimosae str. Mim1]